MSDQHVLAPLRTTRPAFRWRSRLDGTVYGFRLAYNTRNDRWYLDVQTADGTAVVSGLRVSTGVSLLAPFGENPNLPPGQLFVRDDSGADREPGLAAFRSDHRLIYRPEADVELAAGTSNEVF
jgi:hypothetical protein